MLPSVWPELSRRGSWPRFAVLLFQAPPTGNHYSFWMLPSSWLFIALFRRYCLPSQLITECRLRRVVTWRVSWGIEIAANTVTEHFLWGSWLNALQCCSLKHGCVVLCTVCSRAWLNACCRLPAAVPRLSESLATLSSRITLPCLCHSHLDCVPIKTSTFDFMNNLVKNQMAWIIFGTQNAEEILHKWYVARPPQLKNVTTIYLVKGRSYTSDQISRMHLK